MKLIELVCLNCGASIKPEIKSATVECNFCKTTFYVRRNGEELYNAYYYYKQAENYFTAGKYTAAMQEVDKAIKLDNNYSDAWLLKAIICLRKEEYYESLSHYITILDITDADNKGRITKEYIAEVLEYINDPAILLDYFKQIKITSILEKAITICEEEIYRFEAYGGERNIRYFDMYKELMNELNETNKKVYEERKKLWAKKQIKALEIRDNITSDYENTIKWKGLFFKFSIISVSSLLFYIIFIGQKDFEGIMIILIFLCSILIALIWQIRSVKYNVRLYEEDKYGSCILADIPDYNNRIIS